MTLYLIRHGSAGVRDGDDPCDTQRHLDAKGRKQAGRIAAHLADAGISAVLSSPLPRCVQTVEPLAGQLGVPVRLDDRLAEGASVDRAWELVEEAGTRPVVLCSHGDVIPELIARDQRRGMRVTEPTGFAKGSIWALEDWDGTHHARATWNKLR